MKISPAENKLYLVSAFKKVELKKTEQQKQAEEQQAIAQATEKAQNLEGVEKEVVLANIEAASLNPELVSNIKLFKFHSDKDYEQTGKEVGKKIDIYDTSKS